MIFIINFKVLCNIYGHLKNIKIIMKMNIKNKEYNVLKILILKNLRLYLTIIKCLMNMKINIKFIDKIENHCKTPNNRMNNRVNNNTNNSAINKNKNN